MKTSMESGIPGIIQIAAFVGGYKVNMVEIYYEAAPAGIRLFDDGMHGDGQADDYFFSTSLFIEQGLPPNRMLLELKAVNRKNINSELFPYLYVSEFQ